MQSVPEQVQCIEDVRMKGEKMQCSVDCYMDTFTKQKSIQCDCSSVPDVTAVLGYMDADMDDTL